MSVPLLTPTERVRTVHRLHAQRGGGRTSGDTAYLAYLVVLVLAMVVIPALIGLARVLARPEILTALVSPTSERVVLLTAGGLLAACAAAGVQRGPALLPPVLTGALVLSDTPRTRTLLWPFARAALALTVGFAVAGSVLATVLVADGGMDLGRGVIFAAGSAALGLIAAGVWLTGQRIGPRHGWLLSVLLASATVLTALVPPLALVTPWGWLAQLWPPTPQGRPWALAPLVLVALVCADAATRMLERLHGVHLLDQARRWEVVGTAAYTGDINSALATFRVRPRVGRTWPAVPGAHRVLQYAVRDLIGAARTPVRALSGLAFLTLGGFLTGLSVGGTTLPGWLLVALGATLSYAALGTFTDGLRHAAQADSAPTLFGYGTRELFALHTTLPALVAAAAGAAGAGLAQLTGWPEAGATGVLLAAVVAVLLVTVRALDGTKGPLPLELLTPAPSPAGDLSGLMVLAWQADTLLISIGLGCAVLAVVTSAGLLAGAAAALVGAALVIALTAVRLGRG